MAQVFITSGVLKNIEQQVRFTRARFGVYELVDFVAVLIGYAVSAEPTLLAFYERLTPFATAFMALFGRKALPHRCTLSRFLAALDQPPVEALRRLFLDDLIMRTAQTFPPGGLWDRRGHQWLVVDVDGTKAAARQRALPSLPELPAPQRRFDRVCAPAYLGRKRGEVARTRTTVLPAHSQHWLGTFGGAGNGDYRGELMCACEAIISYAGWLCMPLSRVLVRLDGLYGTTAVLTIPFSSGMGVIVRSKEYGLLDLPAVAARLKLPPDHQSTHPESGVSRALFDCPDIALRSSGSPVRLIVATHPTPSPAKPSIGVLRAGTVYELFLTTAPQAAFTCADVLDLYLHRGSFEAVLSDEDREQDTDRWCSRTSCGQECWQIVNQWLWNLRLDLGQHLSASPMRWTEFAPAQELTSVAPQVPVPVPPSEPTQEPSSVSASEGTEYGPAQWARRSCTKGFAGSDCVSQPDGTDALSGGSSFNRARTQTRAQRLAARGLRRTDDALPPLPSSCTVSRSHHNVQTSVRVSAVLWPIGPSLSVPAQPPPYPVAAPFERERMPPAPAPSLAPVLWGDWPRCQLRRRWIRLLHTQTVELAFRSLQSEKVLSTNRDGVQTRAQWAHYRLNWQQRMARNARPSSAPVLTITIYGLPAAFAQYLGVSLITAA